MRRCAVACVAVLWTSVAEGRPVTYPGGRMSMTEVSGGTVISQLDATLDRRTAIGLFARSEDDGARDGFGVVVNRLLMRRNSPDAQANAYLTGGFGPSWQDGDRDLAGWVSAEADWESRRHFAGAMATLSVGNDGDTEAGFRARLGVAPYVAPTGRLHTWLFAQVGRMAEPGADVEVTPVVRLFKGSVLAEAGVSHRGRGFATLWFYF